MEEHIAGSDLAAIANGIEVLKKAANALSARVYTKSEEASTPEPATGPADDTIVDAEFGDVSGS